MYLQMASCSRDWDLLQRYLGGDERAFAELVHEHLPLVYSAALRQVRSPELAEEVAQAVFIVLARKAPRLSSRVVLPAWLHRTTVFASRNLLKREARRKAHEHRAARMHQEMSSPTLTWHRLAPLLDTAVARLREADRQAIVLRFLESKSLFEVGQAMGISEDAAQMRVARALEKLRAMFRRRDLALDSCALAALISVNATRPVPVRLHLRVLPRVPLAPAAAPTAERLAESVHRTMGWARARLAGAFLLCCAAAEHVSTVRVAMHD